MSTPALRRHPGPQSPAVYAAAVLVVVVVVVGVGPWEVASRTDICDRSSRKNPEKGFRSVVESACAQKPALHLVLPKAKHHT